MPSELTASAPILRQLRKRVLETIQQNGSSVQAALLGGLLELPGELKDRARSEETNGALQFVRGGGYRTSFAASHRTLNLGQQRLPLIQE